MSRHRGQRTEGCGGEDAVKGYAQSNSWRYENKWDALVLLACTKRVPALTAPSHDSKCVFQRRTSRGRFHVLLMESLRQSPARVPLYLGAGGFDQLLIHSV